jgi:hypothetical protein
MTTRDSQETESEPLETSELNGLGLGPNFESREHV